jgi:sugar lactone lactonase YvrE
LPDGRLLIVSASEGLLLRRDRDGSLVTYADLSDGICLDIEGAVWYGDVPNRRCVRVAEGGEVLQAVDLDRGCFACMLGGTDRRTLFVVANQGAGTAGMSDLTRAGQVLTRQAPARGAGRP